MRARGVTENRPKLDDVEWEKEPPSEEYWTELQRVSRNQIMCGVLIILQLKDLDRKCGIVVWNKRNR